MVSELARIVRETGRVPLSWAGATSEQQHLNLGDALSPVMVALLSGRPVERVPFASDRPRLAAVGTIGQNLARGDVWLWGTGTSRIATGPQGGRRRYTPPAGTRLQLAATRGPVSAALLGGGTVPAVPYGDPVWLLPRFHAPAVEKTWDLGVVLHLSELTDRDGTSPPSAAQARHRIPDDLAGRVRLISTVTEVSAAALGARIDEIRACRRILSTSLHGLVLAEAYGIPCLAFPAAAPAGLRDVPLDFESPLNLRITDLYAGAGRRRLPVWNQPREAETDWEAAMAAIDAAWEPSEIDTDALLAALPVDLAPLAVRPEEGPWDHPLIAGLAFRHDVRALRAADREAAAAQRKAARAQLRARQAGLAALGLPAVAATEPARRPRLRLEPARAGAVVPLSWAAGTRGSGYANIGDALSAVVVSAVSGLPVVHRAARSTSERLAAVGTIGHAQAGGRVHFWGTGLDAGIDPLGGPGPYAPPPDTEIFVHAMRGPFSAGTLRRHGVPAPEVFGDPVYLLPRIWPLADCAKTHEVGVVLHLSELDPKGPEGLPRAEFARYRVPDDLAGTIRIINMYAADTLEAFEAKIAEIVSCRRILSTSLHGLVIADAYGIPGAWFSFYGEGLSVVDPLNPEHRIDHRMRDLYAGLGLAEVPVYATPRQNPTDWEAAIAAIDRAVRPSEFDPSHLLEAFPGPLAVDPAAPRWRLDPGLLAGLTL